MTSPRVVVLGGGLAGLAAAETLALDLGGHVTVLEAASEFGGLAGSIEVDGGHYPLGYHHVLERDRVLRLYLDEAGLASRLRWRRVSMELEHGGRRYDLSRPVDLLAFPLPLADKLRFVRMMLRARSLAHPGKVGDSSAGELLDRWASPRVREVLFEPLTRLKFQSACPDLSGSWLAARLRYREGSTPLGYLPGTNWTTPLCEFLTTRCRDRGCRLEPSTPVQRLETRDGAVRAAVAADGRVFEGELFVCAVPPPQYRRWVDDATPALAGMRYTALLSLIAACPTTPLEAYWLNLTSLRRTASALFNLSALNPTIGRSDRCLNFVTHLAGTAEPLWQKSDAEILAAYAADYQDLFGEAFAPRWTRLVRVPQYSPVFFRGYRNPPLRSATFENVFFAGSYRTYPSVASTGNALQSGVQTAVALLRSQGRSSDRYEALVAAAAGERDLLLTSTSLR